MQNDAVNSLKHLTSASQATREELIRKSGVTYLSQLIQVEPQCILQSSSSPPTSPASDRAMCYV